MIAPGGSIVYCEEAMEHYREIGTIIYLKASFDEIERRIKNAKNRGVVLKEGQKLREVYEERVKLFDKYADYTVEETRIGLDETIEKVLELIGKIGG